MADERRRYYGADGAAAYDVYSVEFRSNAARPLERPRQLPDEQPLPQRQKRVREKTAIAPFTLFGMLAAACMLVLVIFGYVQLYEATTEVSRLESQLQQLNAQQALLKSKYEGKIDLDTIEQRAAELGLRTPEAEQIVYVNLSGSDRAEIYQQTRTSLIGEIVQTIEQSVSSLIAYLRPASA